MTCSSFIIAGVSLLLSHWHHKPFHGSYRYLESGHKNTAHRMKYMANATKESSTVSNVGVCPLINTG